jgi:thioredoxin reductase/NAD-dependent dihydropyrimidine dehydrogenase PreA subunit
LEWHLPHAQCFVIMSATYLIYALPLVLIWGWYLTGRRRGSVDARRAQEESRAAGLLEPASLHPLIDTSLCVGCGACVRACPEQETHRVLGLIDGKAQLVGPTNCIGHGACRTACPMGAISLVFGTEKRGVDIPLLSPHFETSVPGIFIAGELGGMGLIRNALEQGRQALEQIASRCTGVRRPDVLDLVVVGAGPAGFSASLAALARRLRCVTLEQDSLGGCVFQYPRGKVVMTAPAELPLVGPVRFRNTSKEELLQFWREVEQRTGVKINYRTRVERIERRDDVFVVHSTSGTYVTRHVLLAIGRRGTPRRLEIPGEDLPKVVYRLLDAEQYAGQKVLVVGGGDSALEAAASLTEQPGTEVTLSYRGDAFSRAKPRNRDLVLDAGRAGRLRVLLNSSPRRIEKDAVLLDVGGRTERVANDSVIVSAGGVLPTAFLESIGVAVETKYGAA